MAFDRIVRDFVRFSLLLVEHDQHVVETILKAFRVSPVEVTPVHSAAEALRAMQSVPFDLLLLDLKLTDAASIELIRKLSADSFNVPFIVFGDTVAHAVEAMKLGAQDVLEKPLRVDQLRHAVSRELWPDGLQGRVETLGAASTSRSIRAQARAVIAGARAHSAADRLAVDILRMIVCEYDPKTITCWASHLNTSYSTICEHCRLVRVKAHSARDLGRVLRAICWSSDTWLPEIVLDYADTRTLNRMMEYSGLTNGRGGPTPSLLEFLDRQVWIPQDHPLVLALHPLLHQLCLPNSAYSASSFF